jgi:hypothetical protein
VTAPGFRGAAAVAEPADVDKVVKSCSRHLSAVAALARAGLPPASVAPVLVALDDAQLALAAAMKGDRRGV